jgi:hypothetical protein
VAEYAQMISEFDVPFELTSEQYVDALLADREPERRYIGESIATAETNVNRQYTADGIDELERHANTLATRENVEHSRNVENARTIGQVAGLICSYRDYELAA